MKKTLLSIACLFGSLITNAQTPAASLNFDGINDYVSINSTSLLSMTNAITIEAWVKTTGSPTVEQYIISKSDDSFYMALNVAGNVGKASFYINGVSSGWLFSNAFNITDNNWHHVASTYDGTTIKIYIDGLFDNSASATGTIQTGGNNVDFGCRNNNQFLQGSIDEARIWNVARTQFEINSYVNCEIPGGTTGLVANYHFNQGFDGADNTSETVLTDVSGNLNTGTLTNFDLTGTISNWVAPGAVISGFITPAVNVQGAALNFDGTNDYVSTTINCDNTIMPDMTWEAWVKPTNESNSNWQMILSSEDGGWDRFIATQNGLFSMGLGNGPFQPVAPDWNQWQHIAVVYSGTKLTFYKNGVPYVYSGVVDTLTQNSMLAPLMIGNVSHFGFPFTGNIDEVRVWNTARTQCEINTYMNCEIPASATGLVANYHFNQGYDAFDNTSETSLMDASGNSNNGNITNLSLTGTTSNWIAPGGVVSGFSTPTVCTVASALNFDGSDDGIACGNGSSVNNLAPAGITMEAWINPSNLSGSGAYSIIRKPGDYNIFLIFGNLWAEIWTDGTGNSTWKQIQGSTPVPLNAWTHVAAAWDGTTCVLYQNGIIDASTSSNGNISVSSNLFIGSNEVSSEYFSGSMDEVRIWNYSRTQCEINTYMNAEIPASATGLVANYHFNQGYDAFDNTTETTLMDASGNLNDGNLTNFNLNGTTSNWIAPGGVVNGYTISLAPPTILVNSGAICSGNSFTMTPSGADTYMYSGGSDVVMPTGDATYTVTGTNTLTTCSNDAVSTVTVNELPTITVNSGTICAGQSFTITPSGADTYTYSGGTDVVMPTGDATYSVSGTDVNGCVSSTDAISTISVNALPSLMAITNNTLLCSGETATLSVTGNATTYTWSTTETAMDIIVSPTATAIYTVEGTDANGCVNSTTISQDVSLCTGVVTLNATNVSINVYPNPNNGLFVIELNTNSQVSITNALGQIVFNETLSIGKQNLNIQNQADGIYFVKVTQQNKQHIIKLIKK